MSAKHTEEIMVLSHTPWPGYKRAFLIVFGLSCIYLGIVLFVSFSKLPTH